MAATGNSQLFNCCRPMVDLANPADTSAPEQTSDYKYHFSRLISQNMSQMDQEIPGPATSSWSDPKTRLPLHSTKPHCGQYIHFD